MLESFENILQAITRSSGTINIIDLGGYRIGDKGLKVLLEVLAGKHVSQLNLDWNHISDEGVSLLVKQLPQMKLKKLILRRNQITDKSVNDLNQIIRLDQLEFLDLRGLSIKQENLIAIFEVIFQNKSLTQFHFDQFGFSSEVIERVTKKMNANKTHKEACKLSLEILKGTRVLLNAQVCSSSFWSHLPIENRKFILTHLNNKQQLTNEQLNAIFDYADVSQNKNNIEYSQEMFYRRIGLG